MALARALVVAGALLLFAVRAGAQPSTRGSSESRGEARDPREASAWLARPNPLRAFLPTASARATDLQARGEALLEQRLSLLPGVRGARVRLILPEQERAPLDQALPPVRAQVLLRADEPKQPSEADVKRVVAEALPEFAPIEVSLSRTPPAQPAPPVPSVRVGPFWVAPGSVVPLRIALASCLVSNVVLACLLLRWRRRAAHRS